MINKIIMIILGSIPSSRNLDFRGRYEFNEVSEGIVFSEEVMGQGIFGMRLA